MDRSKLIKAVKTAQNGDETAVSLLYREYSAHVYRLAFKIMGSREEAEDIMQNVFMLVLGKIKGLRKADAFESWLNRITVNCCTYAIKKREKTIDCGNEVIERQEETKTCSLPEHSLDGKETARIICETVDALPVTQKMCVYYHFEQGFTAPQIAKMIGENVNTVKSRIARAKKKIREEITRIEKEQGIRLRGFLTFQIAPALKQSVNSVDVPKSILDNVWSEISAASADSIAKTAAVASGTVTGAGLKLAALIGGIVLVAGTVLGLYYGTDLLRKIIPEPVIEEYNNINYYGNSAGNIINHGIAAIQGDWIFYTGDKKGVYKIKIDGTENTLVTDDEAMYLNVVGDWLYYRNHSDYYKLYKIRTDGTEKTMLDEYKINMTDEGRYINVVDNWIFYTNNYLNKIRTDGTEKTKVNNNYTDEIKAAGDWLYYSNHDDEYKLYKIRADGTKNTKLNDDLTRGINLVDDWIYYSNGDDDYKMYKIRADGTERQKINDNSNHNINISDEWIYYGSRTDGGKIYKTRIDGTENIKLNDAESYNINIVGDWLFYRNKSDSDKIYKMKTDGSENQPISLWQNGGFETVKADINAFDIVNIENKSMTEIEPGTGSYRQMTAVIGERLLIASYWSADAFYVYYKNTLEYIGKKELNGAYDITFTENSVAVPERDKITFYDEYMNIKSVINIENEIYQNNYGGTYESKLIDETHIVFWLVNLDIYILDLQTGNTVKVEGIYQDDKYFMDYRVNYTSGSGYAVLGGNDSFLGSVCIIADTDGNIVDYALKSKLDQNCGFLVPEKQVVYTLDYNNEKVKEFTIASSDTLEIVFKNGFVGSSKNNKVLDFENQCIYNFSNRYGDFITGCTGGGEAFLIFAEDDYNGNTKYYLAKTSANTKETKTEINNDYIIGDNKSAPLSLLGYDVDENGGITLSVDFDDDYVFTPDKFRELFFGTWVCGNESLKQIPPHTV